MKDKSLRLIKWIMGMVLLGLFLLYGRTLFNQEVKLGLFLLIGLVLGYMETRSRLGVSSGYIDFFITGNSLRLYSLLALFGLGILTAVGIHYQASFNGAVPQFRASDSQAVIPGTSVVTPVNFGLILGAFLFGVGLAINRGCGFGTLRKMGQGRMRYAWTILFLLIGTIPGQLVKYELDNSIIHQHSLQVYLPDYFGFTGTVVLSIGALLILCLLAKYYENYRKKKQTYKKVETYKTLPSQQDQPFKLFSKRTFNYLFSKSFPRGFSVITITIALLLSLSLTGETLEVTKQLLAPAVALFQNLGFSFESPAFSGALQTVENGLFNNTNFLQNFAIVFGAIIYGLTSTRFYFSWKANLKETFLYMLSGLLMGFGAVLASGCIVGALYSGIVNFSLSGWVVFAAMSLGIMVTVKVMNGRISTISEIGS